MARSRRIEGRSSARRIALLAALVALLACAAPGARAAAPPASLVNPFAMTVDHAGGRVYWSNAELNGNTISYANLDGSGNGQLSTSGATIQFSQSIVADQAGGRLYFVNAGLGLTDSTAVGFARLDGSGGANLMTTGAPIVDPGGLVLANGRLYWTSQDLSNKISFARVNGSGGGLLPVSPATTVSFPTSVAFDPVDQRLYWTNATADTIASARLDGSALDGSDARALPVPNAPISGPRSATIDLVGRRIYWLNEQANGNPASIGFANLNGTGGGSLQVPGAAFAASIAIDPVAGRIYWATAALGQDVALRSANLDGSDVKVLLPQQPPPPPPPVDTTLHAPVIDDAPPASTPLTDASLLYHAVDKNVSLSCTLDDGGASACSGRSAFSGLAVGRHCFTVRETRNGAVGPAAQSCWTVTQLAPGCTAGFHHGYFITASAATLARRQVVFHATSDGVAGRVALSTRTSVHGARVTYRLDGKPLSSHASTTLTFAQLDRTKSHTLTIDVTAAGHRARITRSFRYASFVAIACGARTVVGKIAPRTVRVGDGKVTISAQVPEQISGTTKLRFTVKPSRPGVVRAARFTFAGKALTQHALNAALTAQQLSASGSQTMTIVLVPTHGRPVTVRIAFRTTQSP